MQKNRPAKTFKCEDLSHVEDKPTSLIYLVQDHPVIEGRQCHECWVIRWLDRYGFYEKQNGLGYRRLVIQDIMHVAKSNRRVKGMLERHKAEDRYQKRWAKKMEKAFGNK